MSGGNDKREPQPNGLWLSFCVDSFTLPAARFPTAFHDCQPVAVSLAAVGRQAHDVFDAGVGGGCDEHRDWRWGSGGLFGNLPHLLDMGENAVPRRDSRLTSRICPF